MQVVLESTSALERKFTITVPTTDVESEFESKLRETSKRVRIDGFRPGKVPTKVVRQRYGQAIRQEIASEMIEKMLSKALSEHELRPIGQPTIDDIKFDEGEDFSFKATFEVFPDIELVLIDGDEIEQTHCKIDVADIKSMIGNLREQRKSWKESPRAKAKLDDRVTINFEGFVGGQSFDGGKGDEQLLILGSGTMIPGFEDGIIGMKKGENRDLELTFPSDYHVENLKGSEVVFKISVTKLERGDLPTVNEEFIKSFGIESGEDKDFKAELKEQMERELSLALKNINKTKVFDKLLEKNSETLLPKAAVQAEIQTLKQQAISRFGGGKQFDSSQLPDELFIEQAERRVRLGFLLGATVNKLEITADKGLVKTMIDEMATAYDDPAQVQSYYQTNDESRKQVEALAIEEQVAAKLLESASIKTIVMSYSEVMQSRQS